MSKFWRSSSNSSSSSSSDDDLASDHTATGNDTTMMGEQEIGEDTEMNGYSTPPRQRIMPIDNPDASWDIIKNEQHFGTVPTVLASSSSLEGGHRYDPSKYTRIVCMSGE